MIPNEAKDEEPISYQALLDKNRDLTEENHSLQEELQRLKARLEEAKGLSHVGEALRESEEKYRVFFENSIDAIILALLDGTIYAANPSACKIFGMTEEEIIKAGRNGLVDAQDPGLELHLEERARTGKFKGEINFRRKDGTIFPGEVSTGIFKDKNGFFKAYAIIRDITKRKTAEDALRKSEERYRTLFTNMTEGFILAEIIYNKDGKPYDYRYLEVNPAFERNTGIKREQILGSTMLEVFPNVNTKQVEKSLELVFTGKSAHFEVFSQLLHKHFDIHVFGLEERKIAIIFMDITERKQMEEKTRQRSEEIETIMEVVPAAILIGHDPQCYNITGNRMANELCEAQTGENISANATPIRRYFHNGHELAANELPMQKAAFKDIDVRDEEIDVLLSDGEWITAIGSASPLHDENGNVRGSVAAFMVITERKKAEARLKETLDNLEELVKQRTAELNKAYNSLKESERGLAEAQKMAHIGSWDWNLLTGKIYWSDEMYRIFGLKPQEFEISFDEILNYIHPGDRDYLIDAYKRALKGGKSGNLIEFRIISANGEEKVIHGLTEVTFNEENKPVRIRGTDQDITERKKAEEALRASEERYRSLYENSLDGILLTKPDGTVLSANPTACNLFGMTEDEVIKAGREGLVVKDERLKAALEERELKGQAKAELKYIRKDGSIFIAEISSGLFTDIDGSIKASIIVRDITERKQAEEALRESEERFRTVIENSRDGINMLDLKTGSYVLMSPAQVEMTGFTAEEINNISAEEVYERVHPQDRDLSISQQKLVAAGIDTPSTVEYRWKVKSGEYRWFSDSRKLVRDTQGNPIALVGISRYITVRKQAEEKIRNLANIVESSNDAIITNSLEGIITSWNKGAEQIYGYLAEEALGKNISILEPEDLKGEIKQLNDKIKQGKRVLHYETLRLKKDGTKINVSVALSPVFDIHGKLTAISVIARDITERKKAEEALYKSKEQYQTLFNSISEGFANCKAIYDEHGTLCDLLILDINPAGARILGNEREAQIGKTWREMCPDEKEHLFEAYQKVDQTGASIQFESFNNVTGRWYIAQVDRTKKGQFAIIFRDITEKKEAQEALAKIETARKKEIHHRIKNNLQVISSLLDLAAEKFRNKNYIDSDEVFEAFRESQNRVMSIAFIHKELHEGGGLNTLNFSLYLQKLAENLFQTYRVGHSGISLDLDLENDVFFDIDVAVPLGMIVNELVSNSFKYAFSGSNKGTIQIKLFSEEAKDELNNKEELTGKSTRYTLIVSDNGVGIPENIDLESSSTLGLQLVSILVDQLDGRIELKSDNGTEFNIKLNIEEKEI
ncbi:MAG: PAS domain S-box protein [Methanosarcina sp.]|nr:PAS domain S-box protein [Methanosarcina sp.]